MCRRVVTDWFVTKFNWLPPLDDGAANWERSVDEHIDRLRAIFQQQEDLIDRLTEPHHDDPPEGADEEFMRWYRWYEEREAQSRRESEERSARRRREDEERLAQLRETLLAARNVRPRLQ